MHSRGSVATDKYMTVDAVASLLRDINTRMFGGQLEITEKTRKGALADWIITYPIRNEHETVVGHWLELTASLQSRRMFIVQRGAGQEFASWATGLFVQEVAITYKGNVRTDEDPGAFRVSRITYPTFSPFVFTDAFRRLTTSEQQHEIARILETTPPAYHSQLSGV